VTPIRLTPTLPPPARIGYDHELGADDLAEMQVAEQRLLRGLGWRGDGLVAVASAPAA